MARHDDPIERLTALFHNGHLLSQQDIQQQLGPISIRQVQRWLGDIRARAAPPLREELRGRTKIFFFDERERVAPRPMVALSEGQILALAVAAEASRAALAPTPLGEPLRAAFDALLKGLSTDLFSFESEHEGAHWHFGGAPSVAIDPAIFGDLTRAIQNQQRVRIDYYAASSRTMSLDRVVEPYGMGVRSGSWLLVARCLRRREMRDFSLAGIKSLKVDEDYFHPPEEFSLEEYFRPRFNALAGGMRVCVRLLVEADRAPYFQRKQYHPTQCIERTLDDERIMVRFEVTGLEEIRSFVQSWGVGVTVIEPPELVARMRQESLGLAERYG